MKACWFCCFLFLGLPLVGECDSVLCLSDEEVDLSLANTGAVPDRFSPVNHLARAFSRLMDSVFDMLAAFAELLAAIFALTDALFAATPAAFFFGTAAMALPSPC